MAPSLLLENINKLGTAPEVPGLSESTGEHPSSKVTALDPIAIVGFSLKFPQEATSQEAFWSMLLEKRCAMTEWPSDRLNLEAFHHPDKNRNDTLAMRGAHFIKEDLGAFDAPFFSIVSAEAMCMDPQHRILLETTYRALENAGISMQKAAATQTGVYTGAFADDFKLMTLRDLETLPKYAITGEALSLLANRISWFFNLRGPSMNIDTACSSSMVALDLACQGLRNRDSRMALVAGSNLVFGLENMLTMSNMNFFSPDAKCFSFDDRANGYSRGEGFGVLIIKRLSDAIDDGDTVRAVIRSTGSNQDGRTPGITQPSGEAQATLIKNTYQKAGLEMSPTRFFEAHGTGTTIGDPTEANAIGEVFRNHRSTDDPLYIGAVKSNIGHLEGSSGIAGIIKSILVLEKGLIPPNTNFQRLNPRIDANFMNLRFPTTTIPWPSKGLRRASVNAFGFGGSNSHVVLDDAYNYLRLNGLEGKHNSVAEPPQSDALADTSPSLSSPGFVYLNENGDKHADVLHDGTRFRQNGVDGRTCTDSTPDTARPRLLVWSAADEDGLRRLSELYNIYLRNLSRSYLSPRRQLSFLDNLAYTLAYRRTALPWKAFTVAYGVPELFTQGVNLSPPKRSSNKLGIAYLFTGQGAQYAEMGRELLAYSTFEATLLAIEQILWDLGCEWSLTDELLKTSSESRINEPAISQPLCTALQVALVDLLRNFGVTPQAAVGHSSGEIAAAYSIGAISLASACKLAYFRGKLASTLSNSAVRGHRGAMMSVGLSEATALQYIERLQPTSIGATVACVNSGSNVTISGDEASIDALKAILDAEGVFTRKLMVDVAYHSPQMNQIATEYLETIHGLAMGQPLAGSPIMISSVTGQRITRNELCESTYWVRNMVSQVRFAEAFEQLTLHHAASGKKLGGIRQEAIAVYQLLEIGPHSALHAPVRTMLNALDRSKNISYDALLVRKSSALYTTLTALGRLHCLGHQISFDHVNHLSHHFQNLQSLADLPEYPFDHSQRYWYESRVSEGLRLRKYPRLDLLGTAVSDWNPLEARWRKIIRISETPWVEDHKVNGAIIYPAAAMFVMAIEAARQMVHPGRKMRGYLIRDATFHHAVKVPAEGNDLELQFYMRPTNDASDKTSSWSDFRVCMYENSQWVENCRGTIKVEYEETDAEGSIAQVKEMSLRQSYYERVWEEQSRTCTQSITAEKMYQHFLSIGMGYGPAFQALQHIKFNGCGEAIAEVHTFDWHSHKEAHHAQDHVIHPVTLDAAAQLIFLALTDGGTKAIPTTIPTRVRNLWVSSSGLSYPLMTSIKAYTKSAFTGHRTTESSLFGLDNVTGELKLVISSLETTTVASQDAESAAQVHQTQLCNGLVSKPDVETLSSSDLVTYCRSSTANTAEPIEFYKDLSFLVFAFISKTLDELSFRQPENLPPHLAKYVAWMQLQVEKYSNGQLAYSTPQWQILSKNVSYVEDVAKRVAAGGAEGRLFVAMGQQLLAVIQGEIDPLSLLFQGELADDYYQDIFNSNCCQDIICYVDLLAHKNPGMKIVELGAGTGGMTRQVLSALKVSGSEDGLARYAQYDYTDISGAYFEKAKEKFVPPNQKMRFKILNIESDPDEQGLEPGSYDLVVAGLVLHATQDLESTMRNVRKLLKPGGKLLMFEITAPEILRTGFAFGLLPGWWLGTDKLREWSPCVSEADWHDILSKTGFSGVDISFHDYQEASSHEMSLMISTAAPESSLVQHQAPVRKFSIVINTSSPAQSNLALEIKARLDPNKQEKCSINSLQEATLIIKNSSEYCMVYLLELEEPFLYGIDQESYTLLQMSLSHARQILWITSAGGDSPSHPGFGMFDGLARVLRSENTQLACVTLALEKNSSTRRHTGNERDVAYIMDILRKLITQELEDMEPEYVERDGLLHINRMTPMEHLNETVQTFEKPQQKKQAFGHGPPLAMTVSNPGMLDSLLFVEDEHQARPLAPGEVEIEVKAAGINFMDCLTVLGRVTKSTVGGECAGVVSRVGSACEKDFQPGDRVCAAILNCFKTFARSDPVLVTKIPDDLSFQHASSVPVTGVTTHYALTEFARLQGGESVLIHSAAGGTGQLAIQIAQKIGAVVYVTVGTSEKKRLLMERYGISEDHILSSRNTSFAQGIMRLTGNKGVDVILNSLSGELLTASWDCIASFGRFIEIGKKDIHSHKYLPMFPFRKNVSFGAVDLDHMHIERPMAFRKSLLAVVKMLTERELQVAFPLHIFPVSETESALRLMQSGKHMGKIVVDFQTDAPVKTLLNAKPVYSFDADASYLIVGGLGGIGRSVARWMTQRGARNVILLSRSGASSDAASFLIAELRSNGVRVEAPTCDVTNYDILARTITQCTESGMPPIRGCIQGAMVLHDALFPNMPFKSWYAATAPKTQASWNIHTLLPNLSFFILLSSISGTLGNAGQANYAAGSTYQDALAAYRTARGQPAIALDLGWLASIGAVAESARLQKGVASRNYLLPISESNLLALLDYYCSPYVSIQLGAACHPVIGLAPPTTPGTDLPSFFHTPPYRTLYQTGRSSAESGGASKMVDYAALFTGCKTLAEAGEAVAQGLAKKLGTALGMPAGDVDTGKPLHAYGVDSLLAVELRNWFGKDVGTDVAIFDIMGGQSIAEVAAMVAGRSRWRNGNWE